MIFFFVGVVLLTLLFGAAACFIAVSAQGFWKRSILIALTGGLSLLGFAILGFAGWCAWDHYCDLPQEVILAQMQQCADQRAKSGVLAELNRLRYKCYVVDRPYPNDDVSIPADLATRSASYVEVSYSHVRRPFLAGKAMRVAFLFDARQQLITWSYRVDEYSL